MEVLRLIWTMPGNAKNIGKDAMNKSGSTGKCQDAQKTP